MQEVMLNGCWPLLLPDHRAARGDWTRGWEVERLAYMRLHLKPGMVVYDVGSEEGDMPALFTSWTRTAPVLFESNELAWPNIRQTFDANDLPYPVASWVGFAANENHGDGFASPWPACSNGPIKPDPGFQSLVESRASLPCISIDVMAARIEYPPDAITMDVEGAELEVLKGATRVLGDDRPMVWVSIHPTFMSVDYPVKPGATPDDCRAAVLKLMDYLEYVPKLLAVDHEEHWQFTPGEQNS